MTESRWTFVAHVLRIAIVFFLVVAISNHDLQWTLECISGIIICSVPILLKRVWNFKLPVIIDFLIVFALFLHVGLGGVFDVYYAFPDFDIITHFVSAVLIAFLALIALYLLHEHWEGLFMWGGPDCQILNITRDAIWVREAALPEGPAVASLDPRWLMPPGAPLPGSSTQRIASFPRQKDWGGRGAPG